MRPDRKGVILDRSARARSRNWLLSANVFELSPVRVRSCKYKRYVRYISTYEHTLVTTSRRDGVDYVKRSCNFVMHFGVQFCEVICNVTRTKDRKSVVRVT